MLTVDAPVIESEDNPRIDATRVEHTYAAILAPRTRSQK